MNPSKLRHVCLFSTAVAIGCSGERPSFPNNEESTGAISGPDAAADGGDGDSSGSANDSSNSTHQNNSDSTNGAGVTVSFSEPTSGYSGAELTDGSTNEEPDASLEEDDADGGNDNETIDGASLSTSHDQNSAIDVDAGDDSSNGNDATATGDGSSSFTNTATSPSDVSSASTSGNNTSTATCVPKKRDCGSSQDNDCDGEPDNTLDNVCKCNPGDQRECQTHPNLDGIGICKSGSQTCVALETGSAWNDCEGSVGPQPEVCTGNLDEDCDGQVNESDACPCASNPCKNGGSCEVTGSSYTCECSQTDFAGDNCDEPRAIVLPRGPGNSDCHAATVSADGSVVGATCNDRPAYWTANTGWQYLAAPNGYANGTLVDVSSNGQVFVATMRANGSNDAKAVRWSSRNATGSVLNGGTGSTSVTGVSADGQRTIGYGSDSAVLVWTGVGTAALYPAPANSSVTNSAVSGDGSIVWSSNSFNNAVLLRWTGATSPTHIPAGDVYSLSVTGVSEDGQVVVGTGNSNTSSAAVWRYVNNELTWLNAGGAVLCFAYGKVSADGSRVAGNCLKPVVWIGNEQLDIGTYLAAIIDDLDADFNQATTAMRSMSADGKYAIGDDFTRVFRVRLPNP